MEEVIEVMGDSQAQADRSEFEAAIGTYTGTNLH
jgi:hypothetical protein